MIQRIGLVRNKFILFIGLIIFLTIFLLFISSSQSNESLLQQKIEKLEIQNEAFNRQIEGKFDNFYCACQMILIIIIYIFS
jgi:hypothetical protein